MDEQNITTKKKKKWLLPTIVVAIVMIAAVVGTVVYNLPVNRLGRQLELARKYMSELNYEAAILAYNAAIEIDPKNVEAYHGAITAYSLADNKDGFENLYENAITVVGNLSGEELEASIELVKDIYLTAPNVYADNEKTAEVLQKGYEVTGKDSDIKDCLIDTYKDTIEECRKDETPDFEKMLDICEKILNIDNKDSNVIGIRKDALLDYINDLLENGDFDTTKSVIEKYKEFVTDVNFTEIIEEQLKDLFDNEEYELVKELINEYKDLLPDMKLEDMLEQIDTLEQQEVQKKELALTVYEYMSKDDYDSMMDVDGSDEAKAVVEMLKAQDKTSYIYIQEDDGSHTGTGVGIYLFGNGGYYFYYGDFVNGFREGIGSIFMKIGEGCKYYFTGNWKNDMPNGSGSVYKELSDGIYTEEGELVDGLWNGHVNVFINDYNYNGKIWDISYNAINGVAEKYGGREYDEILMDSNTVVYSFMLFDGYAYHRADIQLSADWYLIAFDLNDIDGYYRWAASKYGKTHGILGFSDLN